MTNGRPYRLPCANRSERTLLTRSCAGREPTCSAGLAARLLLSFAVTVVCLFVRTAPAAATLLDLAFDPPNHRLSGANAEDRSGRSVLFGDVNGDGRDDLIVAAPEFDFAGRSACGAIFILIASDTIPASVNFDDVRPDLKRIFGPVAGARLGAVITCGDVDGDNRAEIVCGIPGASPMGRLSAGELYVVFGSAAPQDTVDIASLPSGVTHILGAAVFDKLGSSVAIGDVNDDTYGDIIAGAPLANTIRQLTGKAMVIHGSASLPAQIDLAAGGVATTHVFGQVTNDFFGGAVFSADLTGDNVDDIIIGAPESSPLGRQRAGTAYIIPGGSSLGDTIDTIDAPAGGITQIFGGEAGAATGSGFTAGDFDGDTVTELAIGAPEFAVNDGGAVYIVDRAGQWPDTLDLAGVNPPSRLDGDESNANVGARLAAGDFNLDGRDDLVIGAPKATASLGREESGKVYIVFGRVSFPPVLSLHPLQIGITTIYGAAADDHVGSSVATGYINGSGFPDLLAGAEQLDNPGELRAGAGLLFLGGEDITPTGILAYDATLTDGGVRLTWRLADAVRAAALRIERHGRGGVVRFGANRINQIHTSYEFTDATVSPGRRYVYTVSRHDARPQTLFSIGIDVPRLDSARLEPAFPNPFAVTATIPFWLPAAGVVDVTIYDARGARVRVLEKGLFPAGRSALSWDGRGSSGRPAPSGLYFVRLRYQGDTVYHKLLLIR